MENIEIGTRIRVFEILPGNNYKTEFVGLQRAELDDEYFGNKYGINLCVSDKHNYPYKPHFNIDNNIVKVNHVKHVATMVITKLKCECCGEKHQELYACTKCDQMFCHNCQMPYNQFTQIDYDLCKDCGYIDRD